MFREKLEWEVEPKVNTRNKEAMQRIRSSPKKKVRDSFFSLHDSSSSLCQLNAPMPTWKAQARVETYNDEYIESTRRPSAKPQVSS